MLTKENDSSLPIPEGLSQGKAVDLWSIISENRIRTNGWKFYWWNSKHKIQRNCLTMSEFASFGNRSYMSFSFNFFLPLACSTLVHFPFTIIQNPTQLHVFFPALLPTNPILIIFAILPHFPSPPCILPVFILASLPFLFDLYNHSVSSCSP